MVRLQRPLIVLDTIRHDGTSRPSSARVAPVHTVRALPLHMPPPPPALPLRPPSARTEPALAPSPPSRPMTARAQTRGHRPVSGRAMSLRPDSSPGVRRSSIGPRGSPRLSRERSPGINEQLGAASSSVGGRCMDVWDGDGPTPPLPDVAEGTAQSSTFMTGFGDEAAVPQRAHRRRSQDVAAPVVSGMAGIADLALPSVEKPWTERDRAKASLRAMLDMSAEEYVELAFEAGSHSIFDFDDEDPSGPAAKMLNAARAFDQRHKRYSGGEHELLPAIAPPPRIGLTQHCFESPSRHSGAPPPAATRGVAGRRRAAATAQQAVDRSAAQSLLHTREDRACKENSRAASQNQVVAGDILLGGSQGGRQLEGLF